MKKAFEALKNKPHNVRQSISLIVASVLTLFIFIGWIASLPVRMKQISQNFVEENVSSDEISRASVVTPFRTFFQQLSSQSLDQVLPSQIEATTIIEPVQ